MCIGEDKSDTLQGSDQSFLRDASASRLPAYDFSLHSNTDDITWAVLEPQKQGIEMPRFTICRIDPCVMVMVENQTDQRRFCSTLSVEEAMAFACHTAEAAVAAFMNVHRFPEMTQ